MESRPEITIGLDSRTFREYYYLKKELVTFCRDNHLPSSGGKQELTERIACFLDSGIVQQPAAKRNVKHGTVMPEITPDSIIEEGFVCTETHRAFFKKQVGSRFSFNVPFQKWLKTLMGSSLILRERIFGLMDIMKFMTKMVSSIQSMMNLN